MGKGGTTLHERGDDTHIRPNLAFGEKEFCVVRGQMVLHGGIRVRAGRVKG